MLQYRYGTLETLHASRHASEDAVAAFGVRGLNMVRFDRQFATVLMNGQAQLSESDPGEPSWIERFEKLSRLCHDAESKAHIAFLGTAVLAKALDHRADLFALKPTADEDKDRANAFPARILCHTVLVPLAAELRINLGVKSREPLNRQPYLRMKRLDDKISVRPGERIAFEYMIQLVRELQQIRESVAANSALRAFISVRRKYEEEDLNDNGLPPIEPAALLDAIVKLVEENPESGKSARAVVAGLLDVFAGAARVESGSSDDPNRGTPNDVCLRSRFNAKGWEKVFEIHDGPITSGNVRQLTEKCLAMGAPGAAIVMIGSRHPRIDVPTFRASAQARGLDLAIFEGWSALVEQVLFWSEVPKAAAAQAALSAIRARLIELKTSSAAVELWNSLTVSDGHKSKRAEGPSGIGRWLRL